jgi:hypothetical protein
MPVFPTKPEEIETWMTAPRPEAAQLQRPFQTPPSLSREARGTRDLLKEHGIGHGRANALVAHTFAEDQRYYGLWRSCCSQALKKKPLTCLSGPTQLVLGILNS